MLRLPTRTPVEYETNLMRLLRIEACPPDTLRTPAVSLVDCGSTLTHYLRKQVEHKPLFTHAEIVQTHSPEELIMLLQSLFFRKQLKGKRFLVITPFYHLLENHSAWKQKEWIWKIEQALEKVEKIGIHVIVAEE